MGQAGSVMLAFSFSVGSLVYYEKIMHYSFDI